MPSEVNNRDHRNNQDPDYKSESDEAIIKENFMEPLQIDTEDEDAQPDPRKLARHRQLSDSQIMYSGPYTSPGNSKQNLNFDVQEDSDSQANLEEDDDDGREIPDLERRNTADIFSPLPSDKSASEKATFFRFPTTENAQSHPAPVVATAPPADRNHPNTTFLHSPHSRGQGCMTTTVQPMLTIPVTSHRTSQGLCQSVGVLGSSPVNSPYNYRGAPVSPGVGPATSSILSTSVGGFRTASSLHYSPPVSPVRPPVSPVQVGPFASQPSTPVSTVQVGPVGAAMPVANGIGSQLMSSTLPMNNGLVYTYQGLQVPTSPPSSPPLSPPLWPPPQEPPTLSCHTSEIEVPHISAPSGEPVKTTLMMRNLPDGFLRDMVVDMLTSEGFRTKVDFVYVPMNFKNNNSFGYAFVNLVSPEAAEDCRKKFDGYTNWPVPSTKVCEVSWGDMIQGLESHVDRYRNSPLMHEVVNDQFKPAIFKDGVRQKFPAPTKPIRAPRIRHRHDT